MQRRKYLKTVGVLGLGITLAGCTDDDDDDDDNGNDDDDSNGDDNGNGDEGFQVRIIYDGEWTGAAGAEGGTSSIEGEGEETIDIDDDADIISANAQKQDDSDRELTIQILEDGEVVAEESTTAGFGVAQVTHSTF